MFNFLVTVCQWLCASCFWLHLVETWQPKRKKKAIFCGLCYNALACFVLEIWRYKKYSFKLFTFLFYAFGLENHQLKGAIAGGVSTHRKWTAVVCVLFFGHCLSMALRGLLLIASRWNLAAKEKKESHFLRAVLQRASLFCSGDMEVQKVLFQTFYFFVFVLILNFL